MDLVLIILGAVGVLCAVALIVLSTVGQQAAARAHPSVQVTGLVVVNGFDAACYTGSGAGPSLTTCAAAAVRITGSTNTDAFPLGSILTVTAPNDLTVGAEYHGSEQVSDLPKVLEVLALPAVLLGFAGVVAFVTGLRRRRRHPLISA
jgi:hypothetical protein